MGCSASRAGAPPGTPSEKAGGATEPATDSTPQTTTTAAATDIALFTVLPTFAHYVGVPANTTNTTDPTTADAADSAAPSSTRAAVVEGETAGKTAGEPDPEKAPTPTTTTTTITVPSSSPSPAAVAAPANNASSDSTDVPAFVKLSVLLPRKQ